ncbi:MAG: branched-chain amino acid ABC transporter permease [Acidimicrobiia bacterium]|nr:branched-chain amino acid ABC transporter permease [Acidimicrobiia bacterium]
MTARWVFDEGTPRHRSYQAIGWGLFLLVVILVPFVFAETWAPTVFGNKYTVSLGNIGHAVAWMVAILGLNMVVGYTGQLSLGHSFFVGSGAFMTAILVEDFGWPFVATLVVVVPVTFVIGLLVGIPALRIQGLYLGLITFGLAAVFPSIIKLDSLADRTGGSNGKNITSDLVPPDWLNLEGFAEFFQGLPVIGGLFGSGGLSRRQEEAVYKYFLLVLMAAVVFWLVRNLVHSRIGRAMLALRDNPTGAAVSGVNLAAYKTLGFGLSAAVGGVAGMMYAATIGFASADEFGSTLAIFFLVGLIVGGPATLTGPIIGGLVIIFVPVWAGQTEEVPGLGWDLNGPYGSLILGVMLIVLTFLLPGGVAYGLRRLRARFVQVVPAAPTVRSGPAPGDMVAEPISS